MFQQIRHCQISNELLTGLLIALRLIAKVFQMFNLDNKSNDYFYLISWIAYYAFYFKF
ncbi:unnamed protein product (macronuclear) [Paramecium tetraurelia]|uniref:Uncharacterized protein n=1 Tax=Paramecium tetraurelia TaxID=5888 RepID=A0ED60_PARTE|nr:uncharacterized protein GSPATT00004096001 [Paramecium tetraurelia]CAK93227.1 unnamed protein product [Paramecium tetraurelia]|eukprot:XP_001460624.1 hypothetical protein (macronuclear) [Paramecium tetraurelia strain d4-2]